MELLQSRMCFERCLLSSDTRLLISVPAMMPRIVTLLQKGDTNVSTGRMVVFGFTLN